MDETVFLYQPNWKELGPFLTICDFRLPNSSEANREGTMKFSRGFSRMNADTKKNRTLKASPRTNKNPPRFFADMKKPKIQRNQETVRVRKKHNPTF